MDEIPFVDWNGDGRISPEDIAISLAIAEEEEKEDKKNDQLQ